MIRKAPTLAAGLFLAACSVATEPQTVARLGSDPVLAGGTYDSGGGITVAVDLQENQGRTMVCGVWAQSKQQSILTKGKAKEVLDTGSVEISGGAVLRGLRFMQEVQPMAAYGGQQAGCVLTEQPWQAGQRASVRLPRQVVHVEIDEMGGFTVSFVPSGPGAGGS
jgi:hypothetical protein